MARGFFKKALLPVLGGAAGFLAGGPIGGLKGAKLAGAIGTGAALASSLDPGRPAVNDQKSGYEALPPEMKAAYDRYARGLNNIPQNPYDTGRFTQAPQPMSPFESQELYNLQQQTPNQSIKPVGVLEPLNQYQRQALQSYGQPDYTEQGLAPYLSPFEKARQRAYENINSYYNDKNAGIRSREARIGSLARDRDYGGQTPAVEEARQRAILDAEAAALSAALGLRSSSLADMLNAGNRVQQYNQTQLQTASPQAINTQSPQYGFAQAYQPLLEGLPNSSFSNQRGGQPSTMGMLGNLGIAAVGDWAQQGINNYLGVRPRRTLGDALIERLDRTGI